MNRRSGWGLIMACLWMVSCHSGKDNKHDAQAKDTMQSAADIQLNNINKDIKNSPNVAENYFLKGNLLIGMDSFVQAYAAYQAAIKLDSHQVKYYKGMADAAMQGGKMDAAIEPLRTAIRHEPQSTIKVQLANVYMYLRRYEDAKNVLDDVLHGNPDDDHALLLKGAIQKETGDTAGAIRSFQQAVLANSRNIEAYMLLGLLYARKHNPLALQYYNNVIKFDSNYADAYLARATFLTSLNRDAEAKKTYRSLITREPFNRDALFNMAFLYMDEDSIARAYVYFNLCVNASHKDADAYYHRGVCADILGKHKEAIDDYEQALVFNPDYTLAKEALAKAGRK